MCPRTLSGVAESLAELHHSLGVRPLPLGGSLWLAITCIVLQVIQWTTGLATVARGGSDYDTTRIIGTTQMHIR